MSCTGLYTIDFRKHPCFHRVMKAEVRISIKDYRRNKNLKVLLVRPPYPGRRFWVWMNGERWPAAKRDVSLTRVITALRKALVRALGTGRRDDRTERNGPAALGRTTVHL